ncbi:MAG TPA: POTRA domain-containing protein [Pyrinomonadaceae bacterium]|nr:POTRA domain-containing protein [Pyrinomonadaceae bacterium]
MILRRLILAFAFAAACGARARASGLPDLSRYEGRNIVSVEVVFEGAPRDGRAEAELRAALTVTPNTPFAAARVRESLLKLFDAGKGRVANARVEAAEAGAAGVALRFIVRPQVRVTSVRIELNAPPESGVAADDIRGRLNLLETGARVSDQVLKNNADLIQAYLRDRGFYRADVTPRSEIDPTGTGAVVTFAVNAGEQAAVEAFNIDVKGFDPAAVRPLLKLQAGAPFSRAALADDVARVRQAIIDAGFLAPQLDDRAQLDSQRNRVSVALTGGVGPKVKVDVRGYAMKDKTLRELLPVRREGTIDQSAIEEGRRRLRVRLQEGGNFFARVRAVCTVDSPAPSSSVEEVQFEEEDEGVDAICQNLNAQALSGHTVNITYEVSRGRRFRLTDIRIEGTRELAVEDVADDLKSQTKNVLEFIPFLGFGHGFTSEEALARDADTIRGRMRELGYRKAVVEVRQGVALNSEDLVITFAVTEGPLTRVAGVEVRGNQIYEAKKLLDEPCDAAKLRGDPCIVVGAPYARSLARADAGRIRDLYARNGYVDSEVNASVVELPAKNGDDQVRVVYDVKEGGKVFVDQIIINGNVRTQREAILEAIPLKPGKELRLDELRESERVLYNTNAFRQVIVRSEPHGETASGFSKHDVVIDLEELPPRRMDYGGGYSTDGGPLGLFELYHNNLGGTLRQGALRARGSSLHQLFRLEFFDPRFRQYGQTKFSPLAVSAQYQTDKSVTRFFRSTLDRGTFGIVQRLDPEGRPIPVGCTLPETECERTGEPAINRFSFNIESQRVIQEASRTVLFVRYNYEDVRLFNIESLLLAPILQPDRAVRLSRFGATLTRDTRDSQFDPTRGEFFTADFAVALRQLGGNLSFSKLLTTYRRYWRLGGAPLSRAAQLDRPRGLLGNFGGAVRQTIFGVNATLGAANLFHARDRDGVPGISDVDRTLPISERFFSGGSSTLRGFGFEEAGPRLAVCPGTLTVTGINNCPGAVFRNQKGEPVSLNPFDVPVGGNALAVVNAEARIPLKTNFQVVPFYDGGNVFRRVGDIFGRNDRSTSTDINERNLRVTWSHTVGLGFRVKTPLGPLAIDYGYLLNPPEFEIPQAAGPPAIHRLRRGRLHFRFGQTF